MNAAQDTPSDLSWKPRGPIASHICLTNMAYSGYKKAERVCVLGAGIIGLAAAEELRRRGYEVGYKTRGTPNGEKIVFRKAWVKSFPVQCWALRR